MYGLRTEDVFFFFPFVFYSTRIRTHIWINRKRLEKGRLELNLDFWLNDAIVVIASHVSENKFCLTNRNVILT